VFGVAALLSGAALMHGAASRGVWSPAPGPALWLQTAYGWWAVLALVLAQFGLGREIARLPLLGDWGVTGTAAALFQYALGTWALACLFLALALLRLLDGAGAAAVCVLVVGLAARELWRLARDPVPEDRPPASFRLAVAVAALLAFLLPYLAQVFLPNTDWDGAMYQVPLGQRLLAESPWAVDPYFTALDFPCLPHLFYAAFLAVGAEAAILPYALFTSLAVVGAVYALTRQFWGARAAFWAAAVMVTVNVLWEVGVTPRMDGFLTLYFVLAVFAFLLWRQEPGRRGLLPLLGLLLGLSLGVKNVAVFFLPLFGLGLAVGRAHRRSLRGGSVLAALVLLAVPSAFWYVRNGVVLGDPFYPRWRHEMMYRDDDGNYRRVTTLFRERKGRLLSLEQSDSALTETEFRPLLGAPQPEHRYPRNLFNLWDLIRHPGHYETKPRHALGPFVLLGLLLPLVVRGQPTCWLYSFGLVLYVAVGWNTFVLRYALPAVALFACAAGVVLDRSAAVAGRFGRALTVTAASAGVLYLLILCAGQAAKVWKMHPAAYLAGAESAVEFLCHVGYNNSRITPPVIAFINREVEEGRMTPDTTILMVGEAKGALVRCRYLPDQSPLAYRWFVEILQAGGDDEALGDRLRAQGVGYVLVNTDYVAWAFHNSESGSYGRNLRVTLAHLDRFVRSRATVVYEREGIVLVRLGARPGAEGP
jgi:hypothetical protein